MSLLRGGMRETKLKPRAALAKPSSVCRKSQSTDLSFCYSKPSQSPDTMSQPQPQYAPAATAGGQQNGPVSESPPSADGASPFSRYQIPTIDSSYRYGAINQHTLANQHRRYSPFAKTAPPPLLLFGAATKPAQSFAMPAASSSNCTGARAQSPSRPT